MCQLMSHHNIHSMLCLQIHCRVRARFLPLVKFTLNMNVHDVLIKINFTRGNTCSIYPVVDCFLLHFRLFKSPDLLLGCSCSLLEVGVYLSWLRLYSDVFPSYTLNKLNTTSCLWTKVSEFTHSLYWILISLFTRQGRWVNGRRRSNNWIKMCFFFFWSEFLLRNSNTFLKIANEEH
jgi:hypothetical protein